MKSNIMYIFINPWAFYDIDDIPSVYSGDSKTDNRTMWALVYVIILMSVFIISSILWVDAIVKAATISTFLWALGIFGYLTSFIALMIYGICKILDYEL